MGRKHTYYQKRASTWTRQRLCGSFLQPLAYGSDARNQNKHFVLFESCKKIGGRVDLGCWWKDLLDPYRWAVCLSSYSDADDSLSSVCVQTRIWILADLLGGNVCSAEAVLFDLRIVWGQGCREEDVPKEFCEASVLSWEFRAIYGWMCRVRHGLGPHNTEGWGRRAEMGSLSSVWFLHSDFSKF